MRARTSWLLILGLALGCDEGAGDPPLKVVVGSDHLGLGQVRARLFEDRGDAIGEETFDVRETGLPFSFSVLAERPGPFRLELEALDDAGGVLFMRAAGFSGEVIEGQTMYLYLAAACEGAVCSSGQTCTETGCDGDYYPDAMMPLTVDGQELVDVCEPGSSWCRADGGAVERCVGFGRPTEHEECGAGAKCDGDPAGCLPVGTNNEPGVARLHVQVLGEGFGAVTSDDPQFRCEDDCTFDVRPGKEVTLRSEPGGGSYFYAWEMDCFDAVGDCTIEVHGDVWIEARFELQGSEVRHLVEAHMQGSGLGRLTEINGKFECNAGACSDQILHGERLELTASPGSDSVFVGWEGDCYGVEGPTCVLTVDGSVMLRPRFETRPTGPARFDVNGDGFPDAVYAAPGAANADGLPGAGRVYVRFGPISPTYWMAGDSDRQWGGASAGDELGRALFVGDVDEDMIDDVLVSAPGYLGKTGAVFAIFGGAGLIGSRVLLNYPEALYGERAGEAFGAAFTARADVDGDLAPDVVVGAPGDGGMLGRVYVFLASDMGGSSGPTPALIIEGEQTGDRFGISVESAGDLDGDGKDEIIVGAPRFDSSYGVDSGRAYVFRFDSSRDRASRANVIVTGEQPGGLLGFSVTGLGDWQGNSEREWAVSSHVNDRVFVFSGLPTQQLVNSQNAAHRLIGAGFFGAALGGFEDYDGDGRPDLVVGAPIADPGSTPGSHAGFARVFVGGGPTSSPAFDLKGDCVAVGDCVSEAVGYTVGPLGDLNLDGVPELAVGSLFGGGLAGPEAHGRILAVDLRAPGRPVNMGSYEAPWIIEGDMQLDGQCAALSGGRAFWPDAMEQAGF